MRHAAGGGYREGASRARRGTVLIVTMWILLVLVGLVLVMARAMRAEGDRSANDTAAAQAEAVERGAIQYVLASVDGLQGQVPSDVDVPCESVQVGEGAFWILRPTTSTDDQTYSFGITDEASKLNLNAATLDMFSRLPGMTSELAASIIDWRDTDTNVTPGGAEDPYYRLLPDPYDCKDGPLETVEELLLIRGATGQILYGDDANRNGILDPGENTSFITGSSTLSGSRLNRGLYSLVTVYSFEPTTTATDTAATGTGTTSATSTARVNVNTASVQAMNALLSPSVSAGRMPGVLDRVRRERPFRSVLDFYFRAALTLDEFKPIAGRVTTASGTNQRGLINIGTAPREVLLCLPGLDDSDVATLVSQRSVAGTDLTNLAWVLQALPRQKALAIGPYVTGRSYQFSADIVSVAGSGRAFKRCRVVIDARTSPPKVVYWQNLTHLGWPLSPDILTRLRAGLGLEPVGQTLIQETDAP
jgi:type II secretory pathway component PulK